MRRGKMTVRYSSAVRRAAWSLGAAIAVLLLAACGSGGDQSAPPAATRTLIPPTATATPPVIVATPTPTDLPGPAMLVPSPASPEASDVALALQTLLDRTADDLVTVQGVARDDLRLLSVDAFTWPDASWGCPTYTAQPSTSGPIPGYRIVLTDGYRAYVYHAADSGDFVLCEDRAWLAEEGTPVLIDPVAAAMVALCLPDAARRLDVAQDTLRLASLVSLTWPDASVGCPKPGADYAEEITPGYRVLLRTADQAILYHTSSRQIVACTPDEEILPGMLRTALATSTPTPEALPAS